MIFNSLACWWLMHPFISRFVEYSALQSLHFERICFVLLARITVFNSTFNNISVISFQSVVLAEETGENHRPAASHWHTLSHNVLSSTLRKGHDSTFVVIGTDCTVSCEANNHTSTTTAATRFYCAMFDSLWYIQTLTVKENFNLNNSQILYMRTFMFAINYIYMSNLNGNLYFP
jgi:hypothetical protein